MIESAEGVRAERCQHCRHGFMERANIGGLSTRR